jgi:peptidyl-tRNA hydrolase
MYLVLRRGAIERLERAAELAGAAAVACVRRLAEDPACSPILAEWEPRPGKVCLRARSPAQWDELLEQPHALAGERDGEAVAALPPRRRSERGRLLERMQAMSADLGDPPAFAGDDGREALTYVLNPVARMSSGKVLAQTAHAAVMAAGGTGPGGARAATRADSALENWAVAGCPGRLVCPSPAAFEALAARPEIVARVVDAGLTEVPPGTVTVLTWPPAHPPALPRELRNG